MDQPAAKTENPKAAVIWGRVMYALSGVIILGYGGNLLPDARGWIKIFLGGILLANAFTYQPVCLSKTTDETTGLAWAVVLLCTAPPFLLVMMFCFDGGVISNAPLLWGMLLGSILGPGYLVWRYFRRRKS